MIKTSNICSTVDMFLQRLFKKKFHSAASIDINGEQLVYTPVSTVCEICEMCLKDVLATIGPNLVYMINSSHMMGYASTYFKCAATPKESKARHFSA